MATASEPGTFSLTHGGPLYRLLGGNGFKWWHFVVFAWFPLALLSLVRLLRGEPVDPKFLDASVQVRLLLATPLLVFAEQLLERRCATTYHHLREEGIVAPARLATIVARTDRIRDAWFLEAAIALVPIGLSVSALWGLRDGSWSSVWYYAVALPLVQIQMLRWVWHWLRWTYFLVLMSRSPLSLNAIHPDRSAGLRPASDPIEAFALFVVVPSSIYVAMLLTQTDPHSAADQVVIPMVAYTVAALALACGPLLLFSPELYRARHRDADAYHVLARQYVDEFRRRWLEKPSPDSLLGTQDIQALNDLGGSLRTASETRMFPFGARSVASVVGGAILALAPIAFAVEPIPELAKHVGKMLFAVP